MKTKKCSKCKQKKELYEFNNYKASKDGKYCQCKECVKESQLKYHCDNCGAKIRWHAAKVGSKLCKECYTTFGNEKHFNLCDEVNNSREGYRLARGFEMLNREE